MSSVESILADAKRDAETLRFLKYPFPDVDMIGGARELGRFYYQLRDSNHPLLDGLTAHSKIGDAHYAAHRLLMFQLAVRYDAFLTLCYDLKYRARVNALLTERALFNQAATVTPVVDNEPRPVGPLCASQNPAWKALLLNAHASKVDSLNGGGSTLIDPQFPTAAAAALPVLVPPLDVDLMWRSHLLRPAEYRNWFDRLDVRAHRSELAVTKGTILTSACNPRIEPVAHYTQQPAWIAADAKKRDEMVAASRALWDRAYNNKYGPYALQFDGYDAKTGRRVAVDAKAPAASSSAKDVKSSVAVSAPATVASVNDYGGATPAVLTLSQFGHDEMKRLPRGPQDGDDSDTSVTLWSWFDTFASIGMMDASGDLRDFWENFESSCRRYNIRARTVPQLLADDKFMAARLQAYRQFLCVWRSSNSGRVFGGVEDNWNWRRTFMHDMSYGVDLMWHAHCLNHPKYMQQTYEVAGRVLFHTPNRPIPVSLLNPPVLTLAQYANWKRARKPDSGMGWLSSADAAVVATHPPVHETAEADEFERIGFVLPAPAAAAADAKPSKAARMLGDDAGLTAAFDSAVAEYARRVGVEPKSVVTVRPRPIYDWLRESLGQLWIARFGVSMHDSMTQFADTKRIADPGLRLPAVVTVRILQYLDLYTLIHCQRLNKNWAQSYFKPQPTIDLKKRRAEAAEKAAADESADAVAPPPALTSVPPPSTAATAATPLPCVWKSLAGSLQFSSASPGVHVKWNKKTGLAMPQHWKLQVELLLAAQRNEMKRLRSEAMRKREAEIQAENEEDGSCVAA